MKTFAYIMPVVATLSASFFVEQFAAGLAAGRVFIPPFLLLAVIGWFLILSLSGRLWLGGGAGFLLDTISSAPFGTYILSGLLVAVLAHLLDRLFSHRDSYLAKGAAFAVLYVAVFLLVPAARQALLYIKSVGV